MSSGYCVLAMGPSVRFRVNREVNVWRFLKPRLQKVLGHSREALCACVGSSHPHLSMKHPVHSRTHGLQGLSRIAADTSGSSSMPVEE